MGFTGMDRLDDLPAYHLTDEDRALFAEKVKQIDAEIASGQLISGLVDARNERVADQNVLEYGEGATELMTQQTQPATEELTAPQLDSQLRQKGAE